jgi:hypothetical protein
MSLRAFHIIFIVCSIILAIGFGCWAIMNFLQLQISGYLWTGICSFLIATGLVLYEYSFLKKVKP